MVRKYLPFFFVIFCVFSICYAQDTQVDSDLKFGLELYKNKMYDLAEEQFNKFLQQYPTSPSASQARYYLAMSQLDQNKFAAAAANFQNFAAQYPNDPLAATAWINAADSYVKTNDYANAALSYERLQVFYPKDARASNSLLDAAKYFELSGDTSRAELSLLTIEQDYPTSPGYFAATLQLGNLYFSSGNESKAEIQYKTILSSDNDSVRVMGLLALGRLNRLRGMSIQAGKYLDDAIQLNINPQSMDALLESIQLELDAGNFSPAFQRADEIDVTQLNMAQKNRLTFEKAYAVVAVGDDATFKSISNSLRILPQEYKLKLASLLEVKKRYSDGLTLLKNFPSKEATESVLNLYAELAYRAKRMKLADSLLVLSTERSRTPDAKAVVKLLGIEAKSLKDIDMVRRTFYQYQNVLKGRQDAFLYYTARLDENDGNYDDAIDNYRELLSLYPESDDAGAADSASDYISIFKSVNYKDAVAGLADIVSEQAISPNGSILLQLGNLFENDLKDYGKAEKIFRQLIAVSSNDTQRVAQYDLANVLERVALGKISENSEPFSLYEKLALSPTNDSITENSDLKVMEIQMASGDSNAAGNSALSFLRRFPNSIHVSDVNCILSQTMYSAADYNEAIVQAELVQTDPLGTGCYAEAQLVIARSQIAIDSLDEAKSTLENFISSRPQKKFLLAGQKIYIDLLKKMNLDAADAYSAVLDELVPSKYKENIKSGLADYFYSADRYDTAYSIYKSFGDDELWVTLPSSVLYKMAYCKLKSGDLRGAKDIFGEVVTNSSNLTEIADSYSQLGKIYSALGDKKMSAAFFEKAGSGDLSSLVNAAETYFKIGDYQDAIQAYKKIQAATSVDTLRAFAAARLIEIDYKTDQVKPADAAASKFKKQYPGDDDEYLAQFLVDKAEYLIRNKDYKGAQSALADVKGDYRNTAAYPSSMLDMARIFIEVGELEKAQDELNELVNNFPNSHVIPMARFEIGNIYFAQEKFQDAINSFRDIYQDSLVAGDVLHDAMIRLISSYETAGQYDGALDVARKFIAKYPDDPSIMDMKIKVGVLYEELRYFDQALLTFQSLAKEASHDYQAELHYYIGAIYNDKSDYPDAILEFLKVPYLVSKNAVVDWAAQAYYMAGKCYEQMNKPNDAIAMYQKIVDKPNTDKNFVDGAIREINRVKALLK